MKPRKLLTAASKYLCFVLNSESANSVAKDQSDSHWFVAYPCKESKGHLSSRQQTGENALFGLHRNEQTCIEMLPQKLIWSQAAAVRNDAPVNALAMEPAPLQHIKKLASMRLS